MTAASSRPPLLRSAAVSIVDQAWLSLLNFALGLILIRLTAKESYGVYAQLYMAGIFAATIADALIANPFTTLASRYSDEQRAAVIGHLNRFQQRLSTVVAILFGIGCGGIAVWTGIEQPAWLAVGYALYVKTSATREYRRSVLFVAGDARRVLVTDVRYGVAMLAGIGVLMWAGELMLPAVFGVLALANVAGLYGAPLPAAVAGDGAPGYRETVAQTWKRGRLALPGAVLSWITNYSYLYLAAAWLGAAATADLNASRLLLVPISLLVVAWSRVARPMLGRLLAQRDRAGLRRLLLGSVVGIELITVPYALALWLALPWLQHHVLGEKYANVQALVIVWSVYFAINAARWIGTAALLASDRFDSALTDAVMCLVLVLVSMNLLIPGFGTQGAILSLVFVEACSLALNWWLYRRALHRLMPA